MKILVRLLVLILLFSMVLSGCGAPLFPINEVETNNDFDTAQSIPVNGTVINATIATVGDCDVYKFTGAAGYGYRVQLTWVSGSDLDLVGNWYAYTYYNFYTLDNNGAGEDETDTINFNTDGGVCYLKIADYEGLNTGGYKISVTKGALSSSLMKYKTQR